mmetsp:Transcript_38219/g.109766  ORF Transcript_38219/g.109766 Transcript_38219/m.109766 type:complete len:255 (-) Transcript_38219:15-779(-)
MASKMTPCQPLANRGRESAVRTGRMVLGGGSSSQPQPPTEGPMSVRQSMPSARLSQGGAGQPSASGPSKDRLDGPNPQEPGQSRQRRKENEDSDDDADADFRALRQKAKDGSAATSSAGVAGAQLVKRTPPTGKRPRDSSGSASLSIERGGVNVDPCYFDYKAAYKNMQQQDGDSQGGSRAGGNPAEAAMVNFLKGHGLTGPVQSYAKAFAMQGIADSSALVTLEDDRLRKVISGAQLECTDELLLMDALRAFR